MRQAKPNENTYINYARKLASFQLFDIQTAIEEMALRERRDGETAFPAMATVVTFVQAVANRRMSRKSDEKLSHERAHYLAHPELYCNLREISDAVDIITRKRASGNNFPNPGEEPRPHEGPEKHREWRQNLQAFLVHYGVQNDARHLTQ